MVKSIIGKVIKSRLVILIGLTIAFAIELVKITFNTIFHRDNDQIKSKAIPNGMLMQPKITPKSDTTIVFEPKIDLGIIRKIVDPYNRVERDWITFNGMRAVIVRNTLLNVFTGYVGVSSESFLYGKSHDEHIPELMPYIDDIRHNPLGKRSQAVLLKYKPDVVSMIMVFDIINGVTHNCGGKGSVSPVESDLWWITFKCITLEINQVDNIQSITIEPIDDLEFCTNECENLASQIRDAEQRYNDMDRGIKDEIDRMLNGT